MADILNPNHISEIQVLVWAIIFVLVFLFLFRI